mmetsp:Transcript_12637/g.20927  ORF Transcript_12637/g.20927 Transcript_12637/m.20927 type:complete len:181 (-) Transcript_12637:3-545(-)
MPSFKAFKAFSEAQKKSQEEQASTEAVAPPAPPTSVAPTNPDASLRKGMKVQVIGLQARPELNGLRGVLASFDEEKYRWKVDLEQGGSKLFKIANLEEIKISPRSAPEPKVSIAKSDVGDVSSQTSVAKAEKTPSMSQGKATPDTTASDLGSVADEEDEEAFVRSIEQCLKESDVMWDDY